MVCGCFSDPSKRGPTTPSHENGYKRIQSGGQQSHPQPPEIFPQTDNQNDIYNRIVGAIEPVDAQRGIATVNKSSRLRDGSNSGSENELLTQRSARGFERTVSSSIIDSSRKSLGNNPHQEEGKSPKVWAHDRQVLEMAIQAEAAADQSNWNPDLQSEEQRLKRRLSKLALEMKVMIGDGNCQFRAISFGLYGSQDYFMSVREKAVEYIKQHKQEYADFLGEDIDSYLASMQEDGTWGDELTLRAVSDYFGIVINVVTSDQHGWFMRYKPKRVNILLEIFLTYIAPVHYNAIRRLTMTQALKQTLARQNTSAIEAAMKRAMSAEKSLQSAQFSDKVKEALEHGQKLEASTTNTKGAPAPITVAKQEEIHQNAAIHPMTPVTEGTNEGSNGTPKSGNAVRVDGTSRVSAAITEDGSLNGAPPREIEEARFLNPLHSMPTSAFADHRQNSSFDTDRMSIDAQPKASPNQHPASHRPLEIASI